MKKTDRSRKTKSARKKQVLPQGWDEKQIRDLLAHYENQTPEEQVAEHEAAFQDPDQTMMAVPTALVPKVRALIARQKRA
jgi:hypothetical protein